MPTAAAAAAPTPIPMAFPDPEPYPFEAPVLLEPAAPEPPVPPPPYWADAAVHTARQTTRTPVTLANHFENIVFSPFLK